MVSIFFKMEYKERFSNISEIELYLFTDLSSLNLSKSNGDDKYFRYTNNNITSIFEKFRDIQIIKVLEFYNDYLIGSNGNSDFYIFESYPDDVQKNDIIGVYSLDSDNDIDRIRPGKNIEYFKISDSYYNYNFWERIVKRIDDIEEEYETYSLRLPFDTFFKGKEGINEEIENLKIKLNEQKEKEKKEKEEREKENESKEEKWKNNSVFNDRHFTIQNNVLTLTNNIVIEIKKNFNEIFSYREIMRISSFYIYEIIDNIEKQLVNMRNNFKKYNSNGNLVANVIFENTGKRPKHYINGTQVRLSRMNFILKRINDGSTEDEIKIYNTLTQVKVDFLNLEGLSLGRDRGEDIYLKCEVNCINPDIFTIKILNETFRIDWKTAKEYFFYGNSRSIKTRIFFDTLLFNKPFCDKFNNKQELLNKLKKVYMIQKLKEGGDE